jgi:uncharacterized protein
MLKAFASYITYHLVRLHKGSRLADALDLFIYDTLKIFLLLSVIIYSVLIVRSYVPPKKIKNLIEHINIFIYNRKLFPSLDKMKSLIKEEV